MVEQWIVRPESLSCGRKFLELFLGLGYSEEGEQDPEGMCPPAKINRTEGGERFGLWFEGEQPGQA